MYKDLAPSLIDVSYQLVGRESTGSQSATLGIFKFSPVSIMHFNAVAGLALSLMGSASALAAPKLPASGLCPNGQYWDTGKGCTASPPPQRCSSDQYYDSLKGCVKGQPPSGPPGLLCTIVKTLVKVARQDLPVTSFCSSYLSIPVSTKSVTVTAYTTYDNSRL